MAGNYMQGKLRVFYIIWTLNLIGIATCRVTRMNTRFSKKNLRKRAREQLAQMVGIPTHKRQDSKPNFDFSV